MTRFERNQHLNKLCKADLVRLAHTLEENEDRLLAQNTLLLAIRDAARIYCWYDMEFVDSHIPQKNLADALSAYDLTQSE